MVSHFTKLWLAVSATAAAVGASPVDIRATTSFTGDTQNGLQGQGGTNCAQNIVIFARGTTETGSKSKKSQVPILQNATAITR